jgi:hypothetical protein
MPIQKLNQNNFHAMQLLVLLPLGSLVTVDSKSLFFVLVEIHPPLGLRFFVELIDSLIIASDSSASPNKVILRPSYHQLLWSL